MKSAVVFMFLVHGIIMAYETPLIMPWHKFHGIESLQNHWKIMIPLTSTSDPLPNIAQIAT